MRILVLHGPNLNMLGSREPAIYGTKTLDEIDGALKVKADELGFELITYQSNCEGSLIDRIQQHASAVDGIVINPGALAHYGLSLRDALAGFHKPIVEVHISNVHAREPWRATLVISPVVTGQIAGLGWRGYLLALEALAEILAPARQ